MALCEKLLADCISVDCSNPIFKGIDGVAYIFNKADIEFLTYDATNPAIITAITMKNDGSTPPVYETGFKIQQMGQTPYSGTKTTMVEGNISNKYTHTFSFVLQDNCPKSAKIIDALTGGNFLVVYKNDYVGSDGKGQYQVLGAQKGLKAKTNECDKYGDSDGGWQITLEETEVSKSSIFLVHTTGTTIDTASYIESLVSCS